LSKELRRQNTNNDHLEIFKASKVNKYFDEEADEWAKMKYFQGLKDMTHPNY
jgi:hypothetical protein